MAAQLLQLETAPDLVDQVYRALLDAISAGTLAPGQRITQEELADRRRTERPSGTVGEIQAPLARLRVVQTQRQRFDATGGSGRTLFVIMLAVHIDRNQRGAGIELMLCARALACQP